jgi:uncharacterized protein
MPNNEITHNEAKLDESIEETFPASDAPSNTVETGVRVGPPPDVDEPKTAVRDNVDAHRFEISIDDATAYLQYERKPGTLVLVHTEVPPALRGRGLAGILAKEALDAARAQGVRPTVLCPFVRAYVQKHAEYQT